MRKTLSDAGIAAGIVGLIAAAGLGAGYYARTTGSEAPPGAPAAAQTPPATGPAVTLLPSPSASGSPGHSIAGAEPGENAGLLAAESPAAPSTAAAPPRRAATRPAAQPAAHPSAQPSAEPTPSPTPAAPVAVLRLGPVRVAVRASLGDAHG